MPFPSLPSQDGPANVKRRLTSKRRKRVVENDEYGRFVRRVLHAYQRRVANGDIDALADMVAVSRELEETIARAVAGLRARNHSWADIGTRIGVTRQAAQQRWGAARRPSREDWSHDG